MRRGHGPVAGHLHAVRGRPRHALANYEKNIRDILDRLQHDGITPILLSPTPYEESPALTWQNHPGYDAALASITERGRAIAGQAHVQFIDLHTPLARLDAEHQAKDPKFTIVGMDRVHPGATTHLVMAYLILKALHAPSTVASTSLDAQGRVLTCQNCHIDQLEAKDGTLSWQYRADAIPFAVEGWLRLGFRLVKFEEELNQELIKVSGLPDGNYHLTIDDHVIRDYTGAQLGAGVDISGEKTPQQAQALRAWGIYRAQFDAYVRLRDIAAVERSIVDPGTPRPISLDQLRTLTDAYLAKAKGTPGEAKASKLVTALIDNKTHEQEWQKAISDTLEQVRHLVLPKPHRIQVVPVR